MKSRPLTIALIALILPQSIASPLSIAAQVLPDLSAKRQATDTESAPAVLADVTYEQVKPSDTFAAFESSTFVIGYPANWKAAEAGENSFRIAPEAGAAQNVIAYGVVISTAASSGSLTQATHDLAQTLQKSNPGMRVADTPRKIRVGEVRGRAVNLAGISPVQRSGQPVAEHDWLVTLPRPNGAMLYLVFIAPQNDFPQLRPTYQKMLDSVRLK